MILAVLDTNILVSGMVSATNPPGQILNAWRDGQFILVLSAHIIDELERTLNKPYFQKHLSSNDITAFIDLLRYEAIVTPINVSVHRVATHSEDDLTLATAVSAKANYLITGDKRLLNKVGSSYQGVSLVTPKDFLVILQ